MTPFFKNSADEGENQGIRLNGRMITFLFCVLISAFFWLMLSLSKEYEIKLIFPVAYINSPSDKVIASRLPETIEIEVKSSGFNLLIYKIKKKNETLLIDVADSKPLPQKNHYFLLTNSRIDKITSQFSNDIKILKISPDTIFLNFNKKISRIVPVKANLKISFDNLYQETDSVKLSPAFITISGGADVVDKIRFVETEPVNLKNVNDSLSLKLTILKTPELKLIDLSQSVVTAFVNVTKFTEGSIELPIEAANLPAGYELKIFPDKISVKYNVAFQNYEKITPIRFHAVVDYLKIEPGSNKIKVELEKYPLEIRSIKINPEKVEYIIRK